VLEWDSWGWRDYFNFGGIIVRFGGIILILAGIPELLAEKREKSAEFPNNRRHGKISLGKVDLLSGMIVIGGVIC